MESRTIISGARRGNMLIEQVKQIAGRSLAVDDGTGAEQEQAPWNSSQCLDTLSGCSPMSKTSSLPAQCSRQKLSRHTQQI